MENETEIVDESQHGHGKHKKTKWILLISGLIAIILIGIAIFAYWLYSAPLNPTKTNILTKTRLPVVIVGTKTISLTEIERRLEIAKEVVGADVVQKNKAELQKQIVERLILDSQDLTQASKLNITVSDAEVDEQYQRLVVQLAAGNESEFETLVKDNYKITKVEFKSDIIKPELLQGKIQVWFNNQKDLNSALYQRLSDAKQKLDQGQEFGQVAKVYSDDEESKNLDGDAGTVSYSELLPEFQEGLKDPKAGEIRTLVSRHGLHLIKIIDIDISEGTDKPKLHVAQIFFKQNDFGDWYKKQLENIKVYRLLKF